MIAVVCMLLFMVVCHRWLWPSLHGKPWQKTIWVLSCLFVLLLMVVLNKLL